MLSMARPVCLLVCLPDLSRGIQATKARYPNAYFGKEEEPTKGKTVTSETVLTVPGKKPFELVLDAKGRFMEDRGEEK
jgi:hypothetical protein